MVKKKPPVKEEEVIAEPQHLFADFGMVPCSLDIKTILPYARNSRQHSDAQVAEIAGSIKEFGWRQPIVIDDQNTIRAGHGRWLAAQLLGLTHVPCLRGVGLSDTQWRAYVIADNRLAEKATWDVPMLKLEMEELKLDGYEISLTGWNDIDLNSLTPPVPVVDFEDEGPEGGPTKKEKTTYHCPKCGFVFEA